MFKTIFNCSARFPKSSKITRCPRLHKSEFPNSVHETIFSFILKKVLSGESLTLTIFWTISNWTTNISWNKKRCKHVKGRVHSCRVDVSFSLSCCRCWLYVPWVFNPSKGLRSKYNVHCCRLRPKSAFSIAKNYVYIHYIGRNQHTNFY